MVIKFQLMKKVIVGIILLKLLWKELFNIRYISLFKYRTIFLALGIDQYNVCSDILKTEC